jgi:hypothetical protein
MEALDATHQPGKDSENKIWRHWMQLSLKYGGTGCNWRGRPPNMEALDATEIIQAIEIK